MQCWCRRSGLRWMKTFHKRLFKRLFGWQVWHRFATCLGSLLRRLWMYVLTHRITCRLITAFPQELFERVLWLCWVWLFRIGIWLRWFLTLIGRVVEYLVALRLEFHQLLLLCLLLFDWSITSSFRRNIFLIFVGGGCLVGPLANFLKNFVINFRQLFKVYLDCFWLNRIRSLNSGHWLIFWNFLHSFVATSFYDLWLRIKLSLLLSSPLFSRRCLESFRLEGGSTNVAIDGRSANIALDRWSENIVLDGLRHRWLLLFKINEMLLGVRQLVG